MLSITRLLIMEFPNLLPVRRARAGAGSGRRFERLCHGSPFVRTCPLCTSHSVTNATTARSSSNSASLVVFYIVPYASRMPPTLSISSVSTWDPAVIGSWPAGRTSSAFPPFRLPMRELRWPPVLLACRPPSRPATTRAR